MNSIFYPVYQAAGWLLLYSGLTVALYVKPWFTPFEYVYGAVLVGCTALYSHLMRTGFKRWFKNAAIYWQLLYFVCQAAVGGCLAGLMLFACVWGLSVAGLTDPIVQGQEWFVFKMVFWGNAFNMIAALVLWSAFYLTIIKARQLRDANQALATSQLEVLIQQLSPHFLFNVLNNIRAMILDNPSGAREALAQLADILRYSLLRGQNNKVTLEEELTVVQQYLALCQLHFEDRLHYRQNIDPQARALLIPRMLLQLCVENAIKHGIGNLADGGDVELSVQCRDNQVHIAVCNPYNPNLQEQTGESSGSPGIGLKNIRRRLSLMYPAASNASAEFRRLGPDGSGKARAEMTIHLPCESGY